MAGDVKSDVDRLLGCFQRGMSQRVKCQRSGKEQQQTPPNHTTPRHVNPGPNTTTNEDNVRTPQGKGYQLGNYLNGAGHPNVVASKKTGSACKQISPGVFYGSPLGRPATKPPKLLSLLNDIRRDLAGQSHSREAQSVGKSVQAAPSRSVIWATFPRQEQAIQFADSSKEEKLVVFQYQDHVNGTRRFLATTYEEFWHRYIGMVADYRHHYEIIQEGKPCHLYFDLEFNRRVNSGSDGEAMVNTLLSVIGQTFNDIFDLEYDPSWTVELDSSTEDKFSRHLIVRVQRMAFKNNLHVGAFVGEICKRIHQLKESNEDVSRLFVLQSGSLAAHHTALFVDQGVYSRNRSFRLVLSSKAGKTAKLVPTNRFRCNTLGEMQVFMDSLICRMEDNCERLLTFGLEEPDRGGSLEFSKWKEKPADETQRRPAFCLSGKSPFPALDTFVESVACIGNISGRIRSWYWFSDYGLVVYNIAENRYCENIGRPHKSNGVMYIVDFRTAGYYQKCHDPDCRGYRSSLRPIPRHTIPPEYPLSSAPRTCSSGRDAEHEESSQRGFQLDDWEDETWWEEVVSSMSSLECASLSQKESQVSPLSEEESDEQDDNDDYWWSAVEQELVRLEKEL